MKEFIHRRVWQHLPRRWRREALFAVTRIMAPRLSLRCELTTPLIVAGTFSTSSGLGMSARLCHDALKASGFTVYGIDLSSDLMQPRDSGEFDYSDGRSLHGPGTLIIHVNAPLMPFALRRLGKRLVHQKYIIGYWAWELPHVPSDWRHGIPFVHEIWAPSVFTAEAILPLAEKRVRVVPHPIALNPPPINVARPSDRPFTVLTIFNAASSIARKNPYATVAAFRRAFGNDQTARLLIKTSSLNRFPKESESLRAAIGSSENIAILDKTMSGTEVSSLYSEADALVSLHRSEGFGLTIAEAMLRGIPTVATNWSGNVDFLSPDTGVPVPYTLIPAEDSQGTYHYPDMCWADADIEAAAAALRRLRNSPELAQHLGLRARKFAMEQWNPEAYSRTLRLELSQKS